MSTKIKTLKIFGDGDFSKVVGEVLRSLGIEKVRADAVADFDSFEIFNEIMSNRIITRLKIVAHGVERVFRKSSLVRPDERFGAEVNRLVKKNLYLLLADNLGLDYVPYGILHGVRPTKIIQRWLSENFGVTSQGVIDRDRICRRLISDYLTERDKADLLTEVSIRQLPILNSGDAKTVSVYVGIPFCKTRCLYCSFPSHVLPDDNKIAEFMTALTRDIEAAASEIKRYGFKVQTIYVGGGTPTALPENFFVEMLDKVYKNFYSEGVEEFTVEGGRPDTITAQKIDALKKFGVTRVSVNPQTMQQRTLDFIGRKHTVEEFVRAFNDLRAAGDWQINTDLILGLPGERLDDFKDSLEKVLALEPDDITLHALAIKRGSKLQTRLADEINKLEDFDLPSDKEVRRMEEFAEKVLRGKKYLPYYLYRQDYSGGQIENVGWCKSGAEGIYNVQIMGERQTILGIGGAASTKVPDFVAKKIRTAFNAKDLTTYLRDIDKYIERRENVLSEVYQSAEISDDKPLAAEEISLEEIQPAESSNDKPLTVEEISLEEIQPAESSNDKPLTAQEISLEEIQSVESSNDKSLTAEENSADEIQSVESSNDKPLTVEENSADKIQPVEKFSLGDKSTPAEEKFSVTADGENKSLNGTEEFTFDEGASSANEKLFVAGDVHTAKKNVINFAEKETAPDDKNLDSDEKFSLGDKATSAEEKLPVTTNITNDNKNLDNDEKFSLGDKSALPD